MKASDKDSKVRRYFKKFFDRSFWVFVLVGIVNTLFGTAVMFVFYNAFHLGYWISSISNYVLGSILSYFLNKRFTFRSKGDVGGSALRFVLNIAVCYGIAYGLARPCVSFLLGSLGQTARDNISMLLGMCLFVLLNYCGQRFFVFVKRTDKGESREQASDERRPAD